MHNFIVNPSHLSLVACIILLLIFTGCDGHKPSPISSNAPTSASKDFTFITDKLLGNWIGPEGTFLLLTGGDGKYQITIQNLDGPRTFQGRVAGNQIEFERDGVKLSLHASTGAETGMKWLSEKTDCLMVRKGEGYCRDHKINKPVIQNAHKPETCLKTEKGIGPVQLGTTLSEARKTFSTAKFERSSDGEGVAFVNVRVGKEEWMTLYADEEDSKAPINWTKKITHIETSNLICNTENGIHPGSKVTDVERILGKTKVINKSEIESREYIEFANQPEAITFRLDYTAIFEDNSMKTNKFEPLGKIQSIMVSAKNY